MFPKLKYGGIYIIEDLQTSYNPHWGGDGTNFNNKKTNFFQIASFVKKNDLDHSSVLRQAFQQEALIDDNKNLLSNFISSIKNKNNIKSQLYQDVFASFVVGNKFDKTFFEFGATDGVNLSNSYTLETLLGWKGALSEPSPQWHNELKKNRSGGSKALIPLDKK